MKKLAFSTLALSTIICTSVSAHVSVATGPVTANSSQLITLNVPHGCEGFDTSNVVVTLPESFHVTRPVDNVFGKATIQKAALSEPFELYGTTYTEDVRNLTWNKVESDILEADTHLYQFSFRSRIPNTPFKKYYLPVVQSCSTAEDGTLSNEWTFEGKTEHGSTEKPAPSVLVLPDYSPGWNQYTLTEAIDDLSVFYSAHIVWAGESAYSSNPVTLEQIEETENVSVLESIPANTTIWIKY